MNFRMEFKTNMTREQALEIIRLENEKDRKEAEIIIKVMEGKADDLGFLRRKVAGEILHNIQKLALNEDQRYWILGNMKQRVEKGTEHLISCENGLLVVEFDEFGKMGSDYLKRTGHAEKALMKQFKASSFRYLPQEKQEVSE
jgi:hypothetical protein